MNTLLAAGLMTLQVAFSALALGLLFGVLLGLANTHANPWVRRLAETVSIFLRGIPELLLLFTIYYGGNSLLNFLSPGFPFEISPFLAGCLGLALSFAGYAAQVIAAALKTIPRGQFEAGMALGFSAPQVFMKIVCPQIWQHALPGLGNLWQVLLKDTALVSVLGLGEIMQWAKLEANTSREPFLYFMLAAGVYFLFGTLSQIAIYYKQQAMHKKVSYHV